MKTIAVLIVVGILSGSVLAEDMSDLDAPVSLTAEQIEKAASAMPSESKENIWTSTTAKTIYALAGVAIAAWANEQGYLEGIGGKERESTINQNKPIVIPPITINVENQGEGSQDVDIDINICNSEGER